MRCTQWFLTLGLSVGCTDGPIDWVAPAEQHRYQVAPPSPPDFGTCRTGYAAHDRNGYNVCKPLLYEQAPCPDGSAWFPNSTQCEIIGGTCPEDGWPAPETLPLDHVVYVRPGATGGNGSKERPFGTLATAMHAADEGDTLALARGQYNETLSLRRTVHIVGACASDTIIATTDAAPAEGIITVFEGEPSIRNVSVQGPRNGLLVVGGKATAEGLIISASMVSLAVVGAEFHASHIIAINDGRWDDRSRAYVVADNAVATITGAEFRGHFGNGYWRKERGEGETGAVSDNSELALTNTVVGSYLKADGARTGGARLRTRMGSTVHMDSVVFDHPLAQLIEVGDECMGDLHNITSWSDTEVDGHIGIAIFAEASVSMSKLWLRGHRGFAVGIQSDATASLADVFIDGVRSNPSNMAMGLAVAQSPSVTVRRLAIVGVEGQSLLIGGTHGQATLEDIALDPALSPAEEYGAGLLAGGDVDVRVERLRVIGAPSIHVAAYGGANVALKDLEVRGLPDGDSGYGVYAFTNGHIDIERGWISDLTPTGVLATDDGSHVTLRQVEVARVAALPCIDCEIQRGGVGIGVYGGASVDASEFAISDCDLIGVQISLGVDPKGAPLMEFGRATLSQGVIERQPFGINLQAPEHPLEQLVDRVEFIDNGRNIAADRLPVPPLPDLSALAGN